MCKKEKPLINFKQHHFLIRLSNDGKTFDFRRFWKDEAENLIPTTEAITAPVKIIPDIIKGLKNIMKDLEAEK